MRAAALVLSSVVSACSSSGWGRASGVPVEPTSTRPSRPPSEVGLYVASLSNRSADTVGFVVAVGDDADTVALGLRTAGGRLGADAVVEVQLRIQHHAVEASGRAVRWN